VCLVDVATGGDVVLVVGQQRVGELEQLLHAWVRDAVVDGAVLPARLHEAAPAKAREVVGGVRLRDAEASDELADGELPFPAEQMEETQPRRIAERAEVLGDQIRLPGGGGQPEGSSL